MLDFKAKITKIDFRWGSAQTLLGSLQRSARPSNWNKEELLVREGRSAGKGKGRTGRGKGDSPYQYYSVSPKKTSPTFLAVTLESIVGFS